MIRINPKLNLFSIVAAFKYKSVLAYLAIMILGFIFSITGIAFTEIAYGASYYIAKNGSDGYAGTIDKPWRTIEKANNTLRAGDTVYIREGVYAEWINPARSGYKNSEIIYKNYSNEKVTIIGSWGAGANLNGTDYITIDGLTFDGQYKIPVGIYINNHGDHITIKNCIVRNYRNAANTTGHGILANTGGFSYLLIDNCQIYHNGPTNPSIQNGNNIGIFGGGDHITIRGSDIYESYTEDGIHLVPTTGKSTDILIEDCRIWGNKEDGIDIKQVENVTIRNTELWGHRLTSTGGGVGIQIHQGAKGVTVDNVIVHDNELSGIRIEYNCSWLSCPPTQNITVKGSVSYNNDEGISVIGGQWNASKYGALKNIYLYNNVLYKNNSGVFLYAHDGGDVTSLVSKNNVFMSNNDHDYEIGKTYNIDYNSDYNNFVDSGTSEAHSLSVDPKFKDANNHDFNLRSYSPLIDRGVNVGIPFSGSAPDIGAYEFEHEDTPGDIPAAPTNLKIIGLNNY